jgi:hypothetical protein
MIFRADDNLASRELDVRGEVTNGCEAFDSSIEIRPMLCS